MTVHVSPLTPSPSRYPENAEAKIAPQGQKRVLTAESWNLGAQPARCEGQALGSGPGGVSFLPRARGHLGGLSPRTQTRKRNAVYAQAAPGLTAPSGVGGGGGCHIPASGFGMKAPDVTSQCNDA